MQVVILAAGRGTRLQPFTNKRSKAMMPIAGKPMVARVIDLFFEAGLDDFIVVVHPEDREILHYLEKDWLYPASVQTVPQEQPLGTANALFQAAPYIKGDFFLSACDNILPGGFITRMLQTWKHTPSLEALLSLMRVAPQKASSTAIVTLDGARVKGIIEKPSVEEAPTDISSLPLYCFSPKILDRLPQVRPSSRNEYELADGIQMTIEKNGRVQGIFVEWRLTLTTPEDLLEINRHYLANNPDTRVSHPEWLGQGTRLIQPVRIEAGTELGKNCTTGPNVYIEKDCRVGSEVKIEDTVLLRSSIIPDGERISNRVIDASE